jgi:hypothetical protein
MSCGFKFCRGGGKCFLEGVSPCKGDGTGVEMDGYWPKGPRQRRRVSQIGFVREMPGQDHADLADAAHRN